MKLRFFDFEVFPNWWCCVFGDFPEGELHDANRKDFINEDIKSNYFVVTSDDPCCRDRLIAAMQEVVNVGYNIKKYDLMIANAIYQGFTPQQVKIVNDIIINPGCAYSTKEHIRLSPFAKKRMRGITYLDLFDSSTGSLKDKEAILGLSVVESIVDFSKEDLTEEDKADVIKYCKHDVYSAMYWYTQIVQPFIYAKLVLCKKFNIPEKYGYNCTNAGLVSMALNVKRKSFLDAEEIKIELPPKIAQYCKDNLPKEVLDHVLNSKETFKIKMFDNDVIFADGGIHSTYDVSKYKRFRDDTPVLYVYEDDEWMLLNVDAGSYYPSMMIQFGTLSRAIPDPAQFDAILQERFAIKRKKNKTKDDDDTQLADKLILNTTYGASGCDYLDLYDPYQRTRTCRYGQLFLIALANKLYKSVPDLKIIQTNTDGVLIYCRKRDIDIVKRCMEEWSTVSGITVDEDYVEKMWQRDVNNYLMVKKGGKLKVKGGWLNQTIIRPGYIMISPRTAYVCAKAVAQYLMHGTDIVTSIVKNTDLMDFAITCTKGPTYRGVVQRMADGTEVPMYKCNRLIATKDTNYGRLYKVKMYKGKLSYTQMPNTPEHCLPLNDDMSTYSLSELKGQLDYMYYIERASELLDNVFVEICRDVEFGTNQFDYFKE